jgi:eukaryotic-like serine/threonine-protein kinase
MCPGVIIRPRMSLAPGTKFGPYEIVGPLAAGGMGEVYRARDTRLGRYVAIKVLPETMSKDLDRLWRFRQEARAIAALNHPGICTIYDIGEERGRQFIAMEFLEGETLRRRMISRRTSPHEVARFGSQIADALDAAHLKMVVHRDIKPENICITERGTPKVVDFGLAKFVQEVNEQTVSETVTKEGSMIGTLAYMAPEQVRGHAVDGRADIFSLGVVLYEMATGHRPFEGRSMFELGSAILQKAPAPFATAVSPSLRRIILRCLAKDPGRRYQRAGELRAALDAVLGDTLHGLPHPEFPLAAFEASAPPIRAIVVFSLRNLSSNIDEEYFAEGMTEALTAALAQVGALRVVSHKAVPQTLKQIARRLKVDAAVEGTVLRVGDRVRITAKLIDAPGGTHIWADSYERDLRNVLAMQTEIARAIAKEIQIKLTPREEAQLFRATEVDPNAYRLYLKGKFQFQKWTPEGFRKGVEFFRQAIEQDPSYGPAYAGMADCYSLAGFYHLMPGKVVFAPAKAAARQALELDETSAEAHVSAGLACLARDWDWLTALAECKRAIELNPSSASAHHWYGTILNFCGRQQEALMEMRYALDLDPLSLIIQTHLGWVFYTLGEYDLAIKQLRQALEVDRTFLFAQWMLGQTYSVAGQHLEAIELIEKVNALFGRDPPVLAGLLGYNLAKSGRAGQARELLAGLEGSVKADSASPYEPVLLCTGLGDVDQAFGWLEACFADRSSYLALLKIERILDPLRSDPRFQDLVVRINFPS